MTIGIENPIIVTTIIIKKFVSIFKIFGIKLKNLAHPVAQFFVK
jgi:hypothetical protein